MATIAWTFFLVRTARLGSRSTAEIRKTADAGSPYTGSLTESAIPKRTP